MVHTVMDTLGAPAHHFKRRAGVGWCPPNRRCPHCRCCFSFSSALRFTHVIRNAARSPRAAAEKEKKKMRVFVGKITWPRQAIRRYRHQNSYLYALDHKGIVTTHPSSIFGKNGCLFMLLSGAQSDDGNN